jgi:long-chain fatty acid transport protein
MNRVRLKYLSIALAALTVPGTALATNGYFSHGISTAEKGLAGAGVAYSQDTLAAGNNPAGMVWQGKRYDVGAAIFAPMREYKVTGAPNPPPAFSLTPGTEDSENEAFLIPQYGQNWMLDDKSSIGVSVYGNGGMNTEYKGTPGTFYDGTAGVDLSQLFIAATYAAKLSDKTSWGVSGIIAYQRFEAKGLANFAPFSSDPGNLTNNDHDSSTGIGIRIGIQSEVSPGIRLGAAFQPEIDMEEFDDYSGLFADDGDFNIPSTLSVGAAFDVGKNGILLIDVQQINYEDVDAVSNPIGNLQTSCMPGAPTTGGTGDGCLGGSDGGGFGWEDMTVIKVGYQWQIEDWTWRVGVSSGDQPIPSDEVLFNILAPGVMEEHFTFGFTKQLDDKSSINFAAMIAPNVSVDGPNAFDPSQEIELEMDQYELAFTYSRSL